MTFKNLGLSSQLLRAVDEQGYINPTPIQEKAIPVILENKDVLAAAQTGTGKTAGFTLPLLQRLGDKPASKGKKQVRALVLTPTRELAAQVAESIKTYGKYLPFTSTVIFGGVGINPQKATLKRGVDIVIATPGRLLDLLNQRALSLSHVECLILDEADRMLDMGFINDIKKVLALLPKNRQNLLFSATFSQEIKKLSQSLLNDPVLVEVSKQNSTVAKIEQLVYRVDKDKKKDLIIHLIKKNKWKQVLIFTRTKHGANKLSEKLVKQKITSAAIHGNKSQGARTKALADFKDGKVRVLVATDIAARGIDIDQLPHVVNFELPNVPEDYVHRIGRTGRAGCDGEAISLVCIDEDEHLRGIEKLIKQKIPKTMEKGFEVDPSIKPEPKKQSGGQRGGRSRGNSGQKQTQNRNRNNNRGRR